MCAPMNVRAYQVHVERFTHVLVFNQSDRFRLFPTVIVAHHLDIKVYTH